MAKEADQMHAVYSAGEDTPARVLNDVVAARLRDGSLNNDPKALLVAARSAMGRGDFDLADKLAHQAEKNTSFFGSMTSSFQSDTPAKVLKEIQAARLYASSTRSGCRRRPERGGRRRHDLKRPIRACSFARDATCSNMNKLEDAEKVALHANFMAPLRELGLFRRHAGQAHRGYQQSQEPNEIKKNRYGCWPTSAPPICPGQPGGSRKACQPGRERLHVGPMASWRWATGRKSCWPKSKRAGLGTTSVAFLRLK